MMDEENYEGALFLYTATVINSGGISTVSVQLVPGAGNEFELLYATISHNDATASTMNVLFRDENAVTVLPFYDALASVTQNSVLKIPPLGTVAGTGGNDLAAGPGRLLLAGDMDFFMSAVDIDDLEGITVSIVGRVFGGVPTITASPVADETVTNERVL